MFRDPGWCVKQPHVYAFSRFLKRDHRGAIPRTLRRCEIEDDFWIKGALSCINTPFVTKLSTSLRRGLLLTAFAAVLPGACVKADAVGDGGVSSPDTGQIIDEPPWPDDLLSDFEDSTAAIVVRLGWPPRNGLWYTYNDASRTCMHNPVAIDDPMGEWFEVYNPSATVTYDLRACQIDDIAPGGFATITSQVLVPPGAYVALAISTSPGFTPAFAYGTVRFDNDAAEEVNIACGGVLIDRFPYDTVAATDPASAGKSFQLDPDHLTATDNDVRANWCYGSTVYVTVGIVSDVGTPGAPNVQCP